MCPLEQKLIAAVVQGGFTFRNKNGQSAPLIALRPCLDLVKIHLRWFDLKWTDEMGSHLVFSCASRLSPLNTYDRL